MEVQFESIEDFHGISYEVDFNKNLVREQLADICKEMLDDHQSSMKEPWKYDYVFKHVVMGNTTKAAAGRAIGLSGTRVSQIEAKIGRWLRHPRYCDRLMELLYDGYSSSSSRLSPSERRFLNAMRRREEAAAHGAEVLQQQRKIYDAHEAARELEHYHYMNMEPVDVSVTAEEEQAFLNAAGSQNIIVVQAETYDNGDVAYTIPSRNNAIRIARLMSKM